MKGFIKLTIDSIKMYFRNRLSLFWALFFPVTIMLVFGLISNTSGTNTNVGIVPPSNNSTVSQSLIKGIGNLPLIKVNKGTYSDESTKLKNGDIDLLLLINNAKSNTPAPTFDITAYYTRSASSASVQATILELRYFLLEMQNKMTQVSSNLFNVQTVEINQYKLTYSDFLLPGIIALALMQGGLFGVVATIVTYKEKGILRRLFATPLPKSSFIGSQVITYLVISIFQIAILLFIGIKFLNVRIVGNLGGVALLGILGSLIFICFGFFISGRANKVQTAMPVANVITLPMMFLSGVFFPTSGFPNWLQHISSYLPLTYLSDSVRNVMTKGYGMSQISHDILGLIIWVIVAFALAVYFYKWE